jgi:diguanylate cyclase (GGDEF)-like protein
MTALQDTAPERSAARLEISGPAAPGPGAPGPAAPGLEAAAPHVQLARVMALSREGFTVRAHEAALALRDQARRDGDDRLRAEAADCLARCCIHLGRFEDGVGFAREAWLVWQARGDERRCSLSGSRLGVLLGFLGEEDALDEADGALEIAERHGDEDAAACALQAQSLAYAMQNQPGRAVRLAEQATARADHPATLIMSLNFLAESVLQLALEDARATDRPGGPADAARRAGVARALSLTREALALGRASGEARMERMLVNNIAEYSLHVGDFETARAALAEFAHAAGEAGQRMEAHHLLLRGRLLSLQGAHEAALEALTACAALVPPDDLELGPMCLLDLCDAQAALGRFEAALAAHRAYHAQHVRRASEAAQRRARLSALRAESQELQRAAADAQARADDLQASNKSLAREARRLLRTTLEDPLTGLGNRRRMDMALLDLRAGGAPFAVAMIDLDRFKLVNDRFSHLMGDAVLREVGAIVAGSCRKQDLAVRYGGEEFALLIGDAALPVAVQLCERLRERIEGHDWSRLSPGLAVTASFGVADDRESDPGEQLLALADHRLYEAKRRGRNRVVAA